MPQLETKSPLLGRSLEEITSIALSVGMNRYVGTQIADWIYKKRVQEIAQITNLSKNARSILSETFCIGTPRIIDTQTSADGTRKYLFVSNDGLQFEAVYIPSDTSRTLCISSQAGCRMGCEFCMTGRIGFKGNLSAADIVGQILAIDESALLTNVVFMGMGEPLDNIKNVMRAIEIITAPWGLAWSPTRVTLSTIGVHTGLQTFLLNTKVHLAVSLHNPFAEERAQMMPSEKAFPIEKTVKMISTHDFSHQRRVSFEYILFDGVNDTERHVRGIVKLLKGLGPQCRVNLIRFHRIPDSDLHGSSDEVIGRFNTSLNNAAILTTTRTSRGEDIMAACGMLAAKKQEDVLGSN